MSTELTRTIKLFHDNNYTDTEIVNFLFLGVAYLDSDLKNDVDIPKVVLDNLSNKYKKLMFRINQIQKAEKLKREYFEREELF